MLKVATWKIEHLRDGNGEGPDPKEAAEFERLAGYTSLLNADILRPRGSPAWGSDGCIGDGDGRRLARDAGIPGPTG